MISTLDICSPEEIVKKLEYWRDFVNHFKMRKSERILVRFDSASYEVPKITTTWNIFISELFSKKTSDWFKEEYEDLKERMGEPNLEILEQNTEAEQFDLWTNNFIQKVSASRFTLLDSQAALETKNQKN